MLVWFAVQTIWTREFIFRGLFKQGSNFFNSCMIIQVIYFTVGFISLRLSGITPLHLKHRVTHSVSLFFFMPVGSVTKFLSFLILVVCVPCFFVISVYQLYWPFQRMSSLVFSIVFLFSISLPCALIFLISFLLLPFSLFCSYLLLKMEA